MKCPKCGYNSFEHLESCKKCGQSLGAHKARFGLHSLFFAGKKETPPAEAMEPLPETETVFPEENAPTDEALSFGFDFMGEDTPQGAEDESNLADLLSAPDLATEEAPSELPDEGLVPREIEESSASSFWEGESSQSELEKEGTVEFDGEREPAPEGMSETEWPAPIDFPENDLPPGDVFQGEKAEPLSGSEDEPTFEIEEDWLLEEEEPTLLADEAIEWEEAPAGPEPPLASTPDFARKGPTAGSTGEAEGPMEESGTLGAAAGEPGAREEDPAIPKSPGELDNTDSLPIFEDTDDDEDWVLSVEDDAEPPSEDPAGFEAATTSRDEKESAAFDQRLGGKSPEEQAAEEADLWTGEESLSSLDTEEEEIDLSELFAEAAGESGTPEDQAEALPFLNLALPKEVSAPADSSLPSPIEIEDDEPASDEEEPLHLTEELPEEMASAASAETESQILDFTPGVGEDGSSLPPASIIARLGASLLDFAILGLMFLLFLLAGEWALDPTASGAGLIPTPRVLLDLSSPYFLVLFTLAFAYFTLFHFLTGQTPGKMLFRVRVEDEKGSSLTLSQAFLRSIGGLCSLLPAGLGFLTIVFARGGRGWNDRLAGSRVVKSVSGAAPPPAAEDEVA